MSKTKLHHTKRKAAAKKYAGSIIVDLELFSAAIRKDYPEATDEDIQDILDDIKAEPKVDESIGKAVQALAGEAYPSGRVSPPGKKLYDKWRGQWRAVQKVKNPFGNDEKIVKWQFEYLESKSNKTGIPMTETEAELFNSTRRMPVSGVPTEQLVIHGTKPEVFYDLANDFAPVNI